METVLLEAAAPGILADKPPNPQYPRGPVTPISGPLKLHTFVSPDCSFRMMKKFIDAAEDSLLIYIYNVSSRDMLALVEAARDRDVAVEIMYDSTDTRQDEVARLESLGVPLHVAPSVPGRRAFTVCHQKYIVVDGKVAIVSSANWATTSIPNPGNSAWKKGNREWFVAIESEQAAAQFTELFERDRDWTPPAGPTAAPFITPQAVEVLAPFVAATPPTIFPPATFDLGPDEKVIPLLSPQNYFEVVSDAIRAATTSVWIEQQYIKIGHGTHVQPLLKLLEQKLEEDPDFDLRIVSSAVYWDNWEATIASLEEHGLADSLRAINEKFFTHCHNKGVIIDGRIVVVSSTNWSNNSIAAAREAGVLIDNADVAAYYARVFTLDWESGTPWDQVMETLEASPQALASQEEMIHPADLA